jgi:hypothetical protein
MWNILVLYYIFTVVINIALLYDCAFVFVRYFLLQNQEPTLWAESREGPIGQAPGTPL